MTTKITVEERKDTTDIKTGDLVYYKGEPAIVAEAFILVSGRRLWVVSVVSLKNGYALDSMALWEEDSTIYKIKNLFRGELTPIKGKVILDNS